MNLEEALEFINNVVGQVSVNREGHMRIQAAMKVIRDAAMAKETTAPAKKKPKST